MGQSSLTIKIHLPNLFLTYIPLHGSAPSYLSPLFPPGDLRGLLLPQCSRQEVRSEL